MKILMNFLILMTISKASVALVSFYEAGQKPSVGYSYNMTCAGEGHKISFALNLKNASNTDKNRVSRLRFTGPSQEPYNAKIQSQENKESNRGSYVVHLEAKKTLEFVDKNFKDVQYWDGLTYHALSCHWDLVLPNSGTGPSTKTNSPGGVN